jgi:uncharacterized membrane protein YgdD (TMEM256/DUF423 family)
MNHRITLLAAGLLGATGIGFGAFGAHALRVRLLAEGTTSAWETASRYQLLHAMVLFAAAVWLRSSQGAVQERLGWASICWVIGTLLFSGSLYILAAGGPRWAGPVTPLGGAFLLAGWLCVAAAAFAKEG